MRDLCIPIPELLEKKLMEVEVSISGEKRKYNFRLESFDWGIDENWPQKEKESEIVKRIDNLRQELKNYDKNWRLIQIFNPRPGSKFIECLFRENSN
jgi:hypothetical protein